MNKLLPGSLDLRSAPRPRFAVGSGVLGHGLVACLWLWTGTGRLPASPADPAPEVSPYRQALASFQQHEYDRALSLTERTPENMGSGERADLLNLRGAVYLRQSRFDQAGRRSPRQRALIRSCGRHASTRPRFPSARSTTRRAARSLILCSTRPAVSGTPKSTVFWTTNYGWPICAPAASSPRWISSPNTAPTPRPRWLGTTSMPRSKGGTTGPKKRRNGLSRRTPNTPTATVSPTRSLWSS